MFYHVKDLQRQGIKRRIHSQVMINLHFFVLTGGGPGVTDSNGVPWSGAFVTANGDLTVDLR